MVSSDIHPRLVAVIPCYNEERNIRGIIENTLKQVHHVIMVDDGCTDNTVKIIKDLPIQILQHEKNLGKGAALRTGFDEAIHHGDIIITIDGDGQHTPERIPDFVDAILNTPAHIVIGSRFLGETRQMPWLRKFTNGLTNTIIRTFFKMPVTDTQSGYRAFRKEVLEYTDTVEPRFVMETEILINAKKLGFIIAEIEIATIYGVGEQSKMQPTREAKEWLIMISKKFFKQPDKKMIEEISKNLFSRSQKTS